MNLELTGIENAGDIERERVVLRATADADAGRYAIFVGAAQAAGVRSGHISSAYWFADTKIKKGDFVVLYSKEGVTSSKTNEQGRTSYFFYWGWKKPVWVTGKRAAVVETSTWIFSEAIK